MRFLYDVMLWELASTVEGVYFLSWSQGATSLNITVMWSMNLARKGGGGGGGKWGGGGGKR